MIEAVTFNDQKAIARHMVATICRADILSAALALHIQSSTCSVSMEHSNQFDSKED